MGKGTSGRPEGGHSGYISEEFGDRSEDLKDVKDACDGELLIVEVGVDGDIAEYIRCGTTAEDLDGAERVECDSVDLTVLDIRNGTLPEGNDVAMTDLRLH